MGGWLARLLSGDRDDEALGGELRRAADAMPLLARLSNAERERLSEIAMRFLRRKTLEGAAGQHVDDRVRALLALQACLPILYLDLDLYTGWHAVILYPDEFRAPYDYADEAGLVHQGTRDLAGESWYRGPAILAWSHVAADAGDREPAGNVVIHEMAHKLDLLNGDVNGMPPLHRDMDPRAWSDAMGAAFLDLQRHRDAGREPAIDPYAAHSPGEFFAVASELFFAWPENLWEAYPGVYAQLALYYRQDPLGRSQG